MHTEHLRAFDKRLDELLQRHPDAPIFTSFPGIGPLGAATLISEMGDDRTRFPSPDVLLAEAGLAPVTKASGRTRQVRFRYAANRRMRHAIDWWAFVASREDAWSKIVSQTGRDHGQNKYGRCADSAPAGLGLYGAAGPTTAATTRPVILGPSCSPPDPTGSGTTAARWRPQP